MRPLPRARLLRSVGVSVGVFVLFGAVTGLLPNPVYVRMVSRTPADYLFLVATAAFAGAFVYQRSLAEEPIGDRFAAGGVVGGSWRSAVQSATPRSSRCSVRPR